MASQLFVWGSVNKVLVMVYFTRLIQPAVDGFEAY